MIWRRDERGAVLFILEIETSLQLYMIRDMLVNLLG